MYIYNLSSGERRAIYQAYLTAAGPVPFAIGVGGVASLDIVPGGAGRSVDIVAALVPAGDAPGPAAHGVTTVLPGPDITLAGATIVPFAWRPYPGAGAYFLQVWLSRAVPGQALSAGG